MSFNSRDLYEFRNFHFDADKRVLLREGEIVSIPPKAAEVLAQLLEHRGELVERQELIDAVWSDTFVEDGNLNHAISALRKVLGPDAIRTVPRRGYCFAEDARRIIDGPAPDIVIEKRTVSSTVIAQAEELDEVDSDVAEKASLAKGRRSYSGIGLAVAIAVLVTAGAWWLGSSPDRKTTAEASNVKSLAILPLTSFSRDGSHEELRLRITDALITRLGALDNMVVRPTFAVLPFVDGEADAISAGRQLGVDAVLDGRVQVEGELLRVTLQLVSIQTGDNLWSEQFDGRTSEILALQDAISARFERDLSLRDTRRAQRRPVMNNESYEAYLKGRFLWNQRREESYYKALEYFQRSVSIDPKFALGYTGIADCYYLLQQRNALPMIEAMSKAEAAARNALELDPYLSEAHSSMGAVSLIRYNRRSEAEHYYKRAIELDPNQAEPYGRLGMLYNAMGRFEDAHTVLKRAEELDPTSINIAIYLGANYYFSRDFDRAIEHFNRILEFAPDTERVHFFLSRIYEQRGPYELAVEHALKERAVFRPESVGPLQAAYRTGGIRAFWLKQIEVLKKESGSMHGLENHIASRYALLGDNGNAFEYIEKNLAESGSMVNYGRVDPIFDTLRSEPKFITMMGRTEDRVD